MLPKSFTRSRVALVAAMPASLIVASPVAAQSSGDTFACDPGFYQVISGQLAELDPANNSYLTIGTDGARYNAMGYRIADGYLYGIQGSSLIRICLLYTSPSPRDRQKSRMPSSA